VGFSVSDLSLDALSRPCSDWSTRKRLGRLSANPLPERFHQSGNRLQVFQPLGYRIAGSGDPTERLTDVEEIIYRSTGPRNSLSAAYGELMRSEIPDLFDFSVKSLFDDVPDTCCSGCLPLLRNFFIHPFDQSVRLDHGLALKRAYFLLCRPLVKLLLR
jgi:hypothetical protein